MLITDGKGSGGKAEVRNTILQVSTTHEALRANRNGDAYCAVANNVDPASADDDWFYLKNKDRRDLVVYKIEAWATDTNQDITIYIGGTDDGQAPKDVVVPVNMNAGSGKIADADCCTDETDLAVSGGVVVYKMKLGATAESLGTFNFPGGLVLTTNNRLWLQNGTNHDVVNANVYFYFRN